MDGSPIDRIERSAAVGDGGSAAGDFVGQGSHEDAARQGAGESARPLVSAADRHDGAGLAQQPVKMALEIAERCFETAFRREFQGELTTVAATPLLGMQQKRWTPEACAERIFAVAARYLHQAIDDALPAPGESLARAAQDAVAQTFSALSELGILATSGGDAVQNMLGHWAQRLVRLVRLLEKQ